MRRGAEKATKNASLTPFRNAKNLQKKRGHINTHTQHNTTQRNTGKATNIAERVAGLAVGLLGLVLRTSS